MKKRRKTLLQKMLFLLYAVSFFAVLALWMMPLKVQAAAMEMDSGDGWSISTMGELTIKEQDGIEGWWSAGRGKYARKVTGITFVGEITELKANVFRDCIQLTEIVIPEGVEVISDGAFANCSNLESVTIPGTVRMISNRAFQSCTSLKKVIIQREIPPSMGPHIFTDCKFVTDNVEAIFVPIGAASTYGRREDWKNWSKYVIESDIASVQTDDTETDVTLNNEIEDEPATGEDASFELYLILAMMAGTGLVVLSFPEKKQQYL